MTMGNFARMAMGRKEEKDTPTPDADTVNAAEKESPAESAVVGGLDQNALASPSVGGVMVERMADSEADVSARIISIKLIDPDPGQPRVTFVDIEEKAQTISEHGLLHPIVVRPHPEVPNRFMIIDGERRWRAYTEILSQQNPLEYSEIRATVKADIEHIGKLRLMQLLANIQRDDLNPIEEAQALATIKELNEYKTNKALAKAVGKSETRVSRALKLLKLSSDEQSKVVSGELSARDIQNSKGVDAARDGSADKKPNTPGDGGSDNKNRVAKVSVSMDAATNLALILQRLAEKNQLTGIVLDNMSKKELIAVLESRSGDILGSL